MKAEIQSKILRIISENGINLTDVAYAVGCTIQTLSYQINNSTKTDMDLVDRINQYFLKKGFIKCTNNAEKCMALGDLTLEFTSLISQEISILTNEVRKAIKDGKVDEPEKERLVNKIKQMRENINMELNELQDLIEE